jgi:putative oxidoreductase
MARGWLSGGGDETVTDTARKYLTLALRIVLGGVFLYAGGLKITDPAAFAGSVAAYKLIPTFGNYLVAATLPWVEVLCGLLLITGYRVRAGATLILLMNLVFVVALTSAIIRGLDIDCGCFRQGGPKTSPWIALLRDLAFIAGIVVLLWLDKRRIGQPTAS